ncbi:MAG: tRNA (N6-threonylcarbamoyladenosine(37)-N6)-methyltransferase TrmO [Candidatus Electryonea clarkiae]|nr:tRNA (N6-threonylcarbamoyladenosine(37)-N6)-methyltransferase TrmO [Candidatus Electryonea clarkiae]MDP8286246.1 tRNA (N6-threonylcarbamoyladenosine(37)-N6)-methyltransferase TrmO [Candidatus Electryonea clarkiae]
MSMIQNQWRSIGVIRTPHKVSEGTPIQPFKAKGIRGTVDVAPEYATALKDLEGFERIWLIYWFHKSKEPEMIITPYMDDKPRGLFATRAPSRINPIGISAVRLIGIKDNLLQVEDVDMLDGTPLLDIKPYVPSIDCYPAARFGWLEESGYRTVPGRADDRFEQD